MNSLAFDGGRPTKIKAFPRWPYSDEKESERINQVLQSGNWWRMTGNQVRLFEERFAALHEVRYCIGVTNGTHALELALAVLGIGRGDEVIVPAVTFISTGSSVLFANATPVLADIDPETYCLAPESLEKAITPRTKAIIPVHMAGHPCDMDAICAIAKKHGLYIIEDAAHAHGARYKGKPVGSFGDMAIFSFQNGKIMTCGEGGALITNDPALYEKAFLMHGVGRPEGDRIYEHRVLGSNYRMNEFQAAILLAQMERLAGMNEKRETNAALLDQMLEGVRGIHPQGRKRYATLVTHYMYMFFYDPAFFGRLSRLAFVDRLIAEGIPAFICYPVLSDTAFFQRHDFNGKIDSYTDVDDRKIPNAKKIASNVVWLPHNTLLGDEEDLREIVSAILKVQQASTHIGDR